MSDRNCFAQLLLRPKRILPSRGFLLTGKFATHFRMKKLSGRPPLMEGKRSKKIDARFTEEEYREIEKLAAVLGLKKSELLRLRLLNQSARTVVNAQELIGRLDVVGTELGRAGNNINQLARYANTLQKKGVFSPAVVSHLAELLEKYNRNQMALESAMRRIIKVIGR